MPIVGVRSQVSVCLVRLSITRNESPGCRRDRCRTGREFSLRCLPACLEGARLYRRVDKGRLILSTDSGRGFSHRAVTVRGGYTKMTVDGGSPSDTLRCRPTVVCGRLISRADGGQVLEVKLPRSGGRPRCRG